MSNQPPQHVEDDEKQEDGSRRNEFDCPECSANNPYDDGYGNGDEVRCFYCGMEYKVEVNTDGKWKFRET